MILHWGTEAERRGFKGAEGMGIGQGVHWRSQGVHWVHVHPQGREKNWGPNLQGKVVSAPPGRDCTPEAVQEFNFLRKSGRSGRWERLFR